MRIFICYAHKDRSLVEELEVRLRVLRRLLPEMGIEVYWDRNLTAGSDWTRSIPNELKSADIVLVLVSDYAISSDYIWDIELPIALGREAVGKATIIPVIARPCGWRETVLGSFSPLPSWDETVIAPGVDPHAMWDKVRNGIRDALRKHVQSRETSPPDKKSFPPEAGHGDARTTDPERREESFHERTTSPSASPLQGEWLQCRAHLQRRDATGLWEHVGAGRTVPVGGQLRLAHWPGTAPHGLILVERQHPNQGWIETHFWPIAAARPLHPGWRFFPKDGEALAESFCESTSAWRVHLWFEREKPQDLLDLLGRAPGPVSPDGTLRWDLLDAYRGWHAELQALLARTSRACTCVEIPPPSVDIEELGLPDATPVAQWSAPDALLVTWDIRYR